MVTESDISEGTLYRKGGKSDTAFLNSMWIKTSSFVKIRKFEVASFDNEGILSGSQGALSSIGKMGRFSWI